MRLIEFDTTNVEIIYDPLLLTLKPFKALIDRDKSKDKSIALKEIAFISFYTDTRSIYMYILDDKARASELIKDLELPKGWKIDKAIQDAIDFYTERSKTAISALYEAAYHSVMEVASYLKNTGELLEERDEKGKVVTDISKITAALDRVPKLMQNLNAAEQELVKEKENTEGRSKGARDFNMFEDGIEFEDE